VFQINANGDKYQTQDDGIIDLGTIGGLTEEQKNKLDNIDTEIEGLETSVNSINTTMSSLENSINTLNVNVEDLQNTKADKDTVETLEISINATDEDVATLNEKLTEHDDEFKSLGDKYANKSHSHEVSNIQSTSADLEGNEFHVIVSKGHGTTTE
jgi:predicted  nucleic acid-binding Zn-ribbon protein